MGMAARLDATLRLVKAGLHAMRVLKGVSTLIMVIAMINVLTPVGQAFRTAAALIAAAHYKSAAEPVITPGVCPRGLAMDNPRGHTSGLSGLHQGTAERAIRPSTCGGLASPV